MTHHKWIHNTCLNCGAERSGNTNKTTYREDATKDWHKHRIECIPKGKPDVAKYKEKYLNEAKEAVALTVYQQNRLNRAKELEDRLYAKIKELEGHSPYALSQGNREFHQLKMEYAKFCV